MKEKNVPKPESPELNSPSPDAIDMKEDSAAEVEPKIGEEDQDDNNDIPEHQNLGFGELDTFGGLPQSLGE